MIAAFGEILFDVYPDGERLGGAPFNFIYHMHQLTGEGSIVSRIGSDDRGKKIQKFLAKEKMDQHFLQVDGKHPTGTVTVQLDETDIPVFVIEEKAAYDFIEAPEDSGKEIELLYFGTLAQRSTVSCNTLRQLSREAKLLFLDVNLRQKYYSLNILEQSLAVADIVKMNLEELQTIHPFFFPEPFELGNSARSFLRKFSLSHIAVTLGEEGSWIFTEDVSDFHWTKTAPVIDTVGAGDGFSAMMCLGIIRGWPLNKIHAAASEFSAALCGVRGALPEDERFYESYRTIVE